MENTKPTKLGIIKLDRSKYIDVWNMQKEMVNLRKENKIPDCLILTEHEPVITIGRNASKDNLLVSRTEMKRDKIEAYNIERNGDVAYFGPGQLMVYPIIDLAARGRDLRKYLTDLESVAISTMDNLGIMATIRKTMPGLWVNNQVIGAVGVAVSNWISFHGLTLNVCNKFDYSKLVNQWGLTNFASNSVSSILGKAVKTNSVSKIFIENFAKRFDCKPEIINDIKRIISEQVAA
jgi:lipoate-protein ligase B